MRETKSLDPEERMELTVSVLPGTTQALRPVSIPHFPFRVYDTPGLLNFAQPLNLLQGLEQIAELARLKNVALARVEVFQGQTLWVGGVARLDFRSVGSSALRSAAGRELPRELLPAPPAHAARGRVL